ncbi:MAG: patatin-like phospholipase family protein, partial [Pseudomonadota bacterium]
SPTSPKSETFDEGARGQQPDDGEEQPDFQAPAVAINAQDIPSIGIILGPGMGKVAAHAGVLAELEKRKVPIDAVVGLGWGSVIGALYAKKGKVHEVSWRLYKLKKDDLPKASFFASSPKPDSVDSLNRFLKDGLQGVTFSNLSVPFACPSTVLGSNKVVMAQRGPLVEAVKRCLSFPPFYKPMANRLVGAPGEVSAAVQFLKDRDIDVILLVDVLPSDKLLESSLEKSQFQTVALWDTVRRQVKSAAKLANEVIYVSTRGKKMTDFEGRRGLVKAGEQAGKRAAEELAEKYGF